MTAHRVLVVEDEAVLAMALEEWLIWTGYQVAGHASRGEEAVALASTTRPDIILMDVRLAGEIDGVEAAAQIRASLDVPFIFLTAHTDAGTLERLRAFEPCGYLSKPFDESDLRAALTAALATRHARR